MKRLLLAVLPFVLAARVQAQTDNPGGQTIYGDDGRRNVYEVELPAVKKLAESTVALFQSWQVTADSVSAASGQTKLSLRDYGSGEGLCKDEPFWSEKNGAFCSGSLVAPDVIMTAGHCVTSDSSCAETKFVFGFSITNKDAGTPESVPTGEVYGCAKLIGRLQEGQGADYALVKLDRPVTNHAPLRLDRNGEVEKGTPLFVIGHPAGLPTKVAGGANVRDASPKGFFVANLDTYGGNSGSAVFNAATGLVEGILVRGEQDFESRGECRVSKRCPNDGCRGEDVTKLSSLVALIPPSGETTFIARPPSGAAFSALLQKAGVELSEAGFEPPVGAP